MADRSEEYLNYLETHRNNVAYAYQNDMMDLAMRTDDPELIRAIRQASNLIPLHDQSKYGKAEFLGYRMKYYPQDDDPPEDAVEQFYQKAHDHHVRNNPHHYLYWVQDGKPTAMEYPYIIEMVCDWLAMSIYEDGDVFEWWKKEKKAIEKDNLMTKTTIKRVESILEQLKEED